MSGAQGRFSSDSTGNRALEGFNNVDKSAGDDFSRYIIAWKLCTGQAAADVQDTLNLAHEASGLEGDHVIHRPRLLSDNGPCYISGELAEWMDDKGILL